MTDALPADNLVILPENVLSRTKSKIGKDSPRLCGGEQDEEDEEGEVMAAMCCSGETYSIIQK